MSFTFQGYQLTPGMHDERFTEECTLLWGRWDQAEYVAAIVDKDAADSANTPTTQLRKGTAMGVLTATGQWMQWNPYATDGTEYLMGFLLDEIDTSYIGGTTKERLNGILVKGNIKADQIVIAGVANRGLAGTTYEFLLRSQCQGRFLFDDDIDRRVTWKYGELSAAEITAGTKTVTTAMNRTHFSNRGATGSFTYVLPAPVPGLQFKFSSITAQDIVLDGPATNEFLIAGSSANGDTIDKDNYERGVLVEVVRTGASTYQYVAIPAIGASS